MLTERLMRWNDRQRDKGLKTKAFTRRRQISESLPPTQGLWGGAGGVASFPQDVAGVRV